MTVKALRRMFVDLCPHRIRQPMSRDRMTVKALRLVGAVLVWVAHQSRDRMTVKALRLEGARTSVTTVERGPGTE